MNEHDIFSIIPIEVFMDDRLTKTDLRVLGAIMSWRNKATNLMWPKRSQIAERCNIPITRISTTTTHLVKLGWLKKDGRGGCSRSSQYLFCVPDLVDNEVNRKVVINQSSNKTVTEPVTVIKTVTEPVTKTVTEPVTKTVTDSVTRIKQTNEQTIEQKVCVYARAENSLSDFEEPAAKPIANELTAAAVCIQLRKFGLMANPSHADLLELLAKGATMQDFEYAGYEAKEKKKGFAWALVVARSSLEKRLEKQRNQTINQPSQDSGYRPSMAMHILNPEFCADYDAVQNAVSSQTRRIQ